MTSKGILQLALDILSSVLAAPKNLKTQNCAWHITDSKHPNITARRAKDALQNLCFCFSSHKNLLRNNSKIIRVQHNMKLTDFHVPHHDEKHLPFQTQPADTSISFIKKNKKWDFPLRPAPSSPWLALEEQGLCWRCQYWTCREGTWPARRRGALRSLIEHRC